jgi:hypothetical protein
LSQVIGTTVKRGAIDPRQCMAAYGNSNGTDCATAWISFASASPLQSWSSAIWLPHLRPLKGDTVRSQVQLAWWRLASNADVASWATEKLLFQRDEEARWTIPEVHHCAGVLCRKVTCAFVLHQWN